MKIKLLEKEIWWLWSWDYWRIEFTLNFDIKKYKYLSLDLGLLLFAIRFYIEWE
jgi:hypothetical protein